MNVELMKQTVLNRTGRPGLLVQKYSPEILMAGGILGVVAGTVWACRATLKASEILSDSERLLEDIDALHDARDEEQYSDSDYERDKALASEILSDSERLLEDIDALHDARDEEEYSDSEYERDKVLVYVQTGIEIVKQYMPAIVLGGVGVAMLLQSRNILTKRNAGLLAAYKAVDEAYSHYRERVKDELGEDFDTYLRMREKEDGQEFEVKIKGKKGKAAEFEIGPEEKSMLNFGASQYAKIFDSSSPQWRSNNEQNIFFLKAQQTNANVTLTTRGHIFLNEIYDMLGIPRTQAGAVVGWVKDNADDVIDFGIFNPLNGYNDDYINGYERQAIILDFNVDGWIWDLI